MSGFSGWFAAAGAALLASPSPFAPLAPGGGELPPVDSAGGPSRAMSGEEALRWLAGREMFSREFQDRDGLGAPGFNAQSCAFCHKEPALGGAGGPEVDVLTLRGEGQYDPGTVAGNQLERMQTFRNALTEAMKTHSPSGQQAKAPNGNLLAGLFDVRQTPSLLGLGLIDTIPDDEILKNEDPNDLNRDGVRGIASRVTVWGTAEVGRFGWKGEVPRLADFVCRALGGELGLTAPAQGRGFGLAEDGDRARDPETSQKELDDLGFFVANLAAPQRGEARDAWEAQRGENIFERLGCALCHVPVLYGTEGPVALYSDLLLHEIQKQEERESIRHLVIRLGPPSDEKPDGEVDTAEHLFRTAPLWGVGRTAPYLHDGRAKTLHEAVLAHEVEAAWTREGYEALFEADRAALMAFLDSL